MKVSTIILLSLLPISLICQDSLLISNQFKNEINWTSNFIFESNGLNKEFLNSMLYSGNITDEMKDKWIESSNKKNIISSDIRNGISYSYHFKKQSIGFSFTDVNILNASFTNDLLRLAFEGNFYHQNKTLDIGGTSVRADRFQQYKISYSKKYNNMKINGGISYLIGNHHLSYIIEKGSLYTANFGAYLDLEYSMNAFVTDTSDFSLFKNNGNGLAIDFSTSFKVKKYIINFKIEDLGFIIWNNSSIILESDSLFNFQGVEVVDVFNFNDSILAANDIMQEINKTNTKSFKSYIPATFHLSLTGKSKNKYIKKYTLGIISKWQPYMDNEPLSFSKIGQGLKESNYSPLLYFSSEFESKSFDIIPNLSYGGYNEEINIGLILSKGKKNTFAIGTHHLEDIFNGNKAKAASLYFNIRLQF